MVMRARKRKPSEKPWETFHRGQLRSPGNTELSGDRFAERL